ncbi:diphosphomevalonate decarboxylase [Anncaliia algerae PRA109]|nr:diphosphomevalonate decarboxylase [Anncaliia algerae PRA109]
MSKTLKTYTSTLYPNIALIKYWGKSDEKENKPTNESISITLNKLKTITTISESSEDEFILDGNKLEMPSRMKNLLEYFRNRSIFKTKIKIESQNNFPHSCGLASSSSGYSALVKGLKGFFELNIDEKELSILARKGSGSASRSIFDGFVHLKKENDEYFSCKIADCLNLKVLIVILDSKVKKVSSTEGMNRTVSTSNLFKMRLSNIQEKINRMLAYIKEENYDGILNLTMRDSNEIHALCLDSFPPIFYLNENSHKVIDIVHGINKEEIKLGYTFDAGPNAFLIIKNEFYEEVKRIFEKEFKLVEGL